MNIPNYVDMQVIDKDGFFTNEWKIIMQQLMQTLQKNASEEGLVAPSQSNAAPPNDNVLQIQNNQVLTPTGLQYTCQFGTLIYDTTNNALLVAIDNGVGVPVFHTVVVI